MGNTKEITPTEYAKWRGVRLAAITKHIRDKNFKNLPYVIEIKNWSRFYIFVVPDFVGLTSFNTLKSNGTLVKSESGKKKAKYFEHGGYYKY